MSVQRAKFYVVPGNVLLPGRPGGITLPGMGSRDPSANRRSGQPPGSPESKPPLPTPPLLIWPSKERNHHQFWGEGPREGALRWVWAGQTRMGHREANSQLPPLASGTESSLVIDKVPEPTPQTWLDLQVSSCWLCPLGKLLTAPPQVKPVWGFRGQSQRWPLGPKERGAVAGRRAADMSAACGCASQGAECPVVMQSLQGGKCQHCAGTPLTLSSCCLCPAGSRLCSNSDSSPMFILHLHSCRTWWHWCTPSCFPSLSCLVRSCSQLLYRSLYFKVIARQIPVSSPRKHFLLLPQKADLFLPPTSCEHLTCSWQLATVPPPW